MQRRNPTEPSAPRAGLEQPECKRTRGADCAPQPITFGRFLLVCLGVVLYVDAIYFALSYFGFLAEYVHENRDMVDSPAKVGLIIANAAGPFAFAFAAWWTMRKVRTAPRMTDIGEGWSERPTERPDTERPHKRPVKIRPVKNLQVSVGDRVLLDVDALDLRTDRPPIDWLPRREEAHVERVSETAAYVRCTTWTEGYPATPRKLWVVFAAITEVLEAE